MLELPIRTQSGLQICLYIMLMSYQLVQSQPKKTTKHVKMTITAVRCFSFVNGVSPTDGCPAAVCKSRVGFTDITKEAI